MSYIEREVALQIIDNYAKTVTADGKVVVNAVRDIVGVITPSADVVEVVRCKDCIKKDTPNCAMWYDCGKCKGQWSWCNPNDFCSYGERSESGKGTDN